MGARILAHSRGDVKKPAGEPRAEPGHNCPLIEVKE
jgi:hypothetical protein